MANANTIASSEPTDTNCFSIQHLHANLIGQVFKKLELISLNSILTSNMTTISSTENSTNNFACNNFGSKNFSINPKLASAEDTDLTSHMNKSLMLTSSNSHLKKSFTLTRKYSSKEQQKEHEQQQKRQSIKSHSSLKNLSNLDAVELLHKSPNYLSFADCATSRPGLGNANRLFNNFFISIDNANLMHCF